MSKKLAYIRSASLEIKERGILNFWIHVDYEEGMSQGVGGISLDTYNTDTKEREGTAYGCEVIRRLLLALNVNDFSQMAGMTIWVLGDGDGSRFSPAGIQSLKSCKGSQNPVIFKEIYEAMRRAGDE